MSDYYLWLKTLHIISFTAWMAGMFYLPRLFAYHAEAKIGSETSELFKTMERRLLRIIMNPAMILTWIFGIALVLHTGAGAPGTGIWIHVKLLLVLAMSGLHGFLAMCRGQFERDQNMRSAKFFRIINEVPTLLLIGIVILVVFKPF